MNTNRKGFFAPKYIDFRTSRSVFDAHYIYALYDKYVVRVKKKIKLDTVEPWSIDTDTHLYII